jgi:hypothetical protein
MEGLPSEDIYLSNHDGSIMSPLDHVSLDAGSQAAVQRVYADAMAAEAQAAAIAAEAQAARSAAEYAVGASVAKQATPALAQAADSQHRVVEREAKMQRQTPVLPNNDMLHRKLLDMLPSPVFVRSATGDILYANRALIDAVGVPEGSVPASWQIAPHVPGTTEPGNNADHARAVALSGEHDLPPDMPADPSGGLPPVPLPAAQLGISVALTHSQHTQPSAVLQMNRIPFWLAAPAADGGVSDQHRAVVLYVQVRPPPSAMFFPAVSQYTARAGDKRSIGSIG